MDGSHLKAVGAYGVSLNGSRQYPKGETEAH
jgi:hypothetical protein